jgi:hypothetical protein
MMIMIAVSICMGITSFSQRHLDFSKLRRCHRSVSPYRAVNAFSSLHQIALALAPPRPAA